MWNHSWGCVWDYGSTDKALFTFRGTVGGFALFNDNNLDSDLELSFGYRCIKIFTPTWDTGLTMINFIQESLIFPPGCTAPWLGGGVCFSRDHCRDMKYKSIIIALFLLLGAIIEMPLQAQPGEALKCLGPDLRCSKAVGRRWKVEIVLEIHKIDPLGKMDVQYFNGRVGSRGLRPGGQGRQRNQDIDKAA